MPWNDTSKSADNPGPWDPPSTEERGLPEPQGTGSRPPPSASPWGDPAPEPARPEPRRRTPAKPPRPSAPPPARGPHLDQLGRELRARLSRVAHRSATPRLRLAITLGLAAGLVAGWAASGVYVVGQDQTAVVTRFGAQVQKVGPGVHYHLPAPFEATRMLPLETVSRLDLGSADADDASARILTRDDAMMAPAYTVLWRVTDPSRYLRAAADPDALLRAAAQAAMRQAIGEATLAELLSGDRGGVASRAALHLQAALDRAGAGVRIEGVQVRDMQPPAAAQAALHEVSAAGAEAQAGLRGAEAYRDRVVAEAKGDAAKAVQASQGYRDQEISEARGEATRFGLVDRAYRRYPDVTRERLYIETMERVLHATRKVVVQTPQGGASVVLPPEAFRTRPEPTAPMAGAGQAPDAGPAASSQKSAPDAGGTAP